jgi:hypothetical protein
MTIHCNDGDDNSLRRSGVLLIHNIFEQIRFQLRLTRTAGCGEMKHLDSSQGFAKVLSYLLEQRGLRPVLLKGLGLDLEPRASDLDSGRHRGLRNGLTIGQAEIGSVVIELLRPMWG